MNKNLVSFLVFVVGLAVFHNAIFPIFTPKPIGWILNRYVYYLVFIAFLIITHFVLRLKPSIAMKALFVWFLGYYFYDAILFPPIPWTLFITYMVMWSIGVFLYISQDTDSFREFREPIVKTIVGEYKVAQIVVMIAMPILIGFATYKSIYPAYQEPVELRTVHPAPPATTKVHGITYPLESTNNPFRIDEQDKYKDSFPFLDADKQEYMKYVTEGGTIFFQNCHYCHGDQLNGIGMFSHVFNPTPANFIDPGTIAMLQESFLFWRVAKGGPGLPNESTPWSSSMPPWEEHLKTDEIWKVVLFEFWYTGHHPRTFGTEGAIAGSEGGE